MKEKLVCQTDHDGYYVGLTVADESPLEPGVFLIPGGCIDTKPPELTENTRYKWNNNKWVAEKIIIQQETPEPEIVLTDEEKLEIKKTDKRIAFQEECDPLFFKWQRGQATKEEWLAKIEEIEKRFE
jgi:hypothetical protein